MRRMLALLIAITVFAAACSASTTTSSSTSAAVEDPPPAEDVAAEPDPTAAPEPTTAPEPTAVPEPTVDPAETLMAEIAAAVDEWRAEANVPGVSLAIIPPGGGEPILVASGVRDLATNDPVSTDDYFRIGSITKPVTSALILQLVEEGLVDLDAPISTYLDNWAPGYEYEDTVTVRQALNHTDGFIEYAFDPGFYALTIPRGDVPLEPQEILDFAASRGPLYEPGTEYVYNTTGYLAAGLVLEEVTGNAAVDEYRQRFLDPLGLEHFFLAPSEFPPVSVVHGYARAELAAAFVALGAATEEDAIDSGGEDFYDVLAGPQAVLQSAGWTGGGVEAQLLDVAVLFRAFFAEGLLSDESIAEMSTTVLDVDYGLGLDVKVDDEGRTVFSHGGGVPGFRSHARHYPEFDLTIAFSANLIPLEVSVSTLAGRLADIMFAV